MHFIRKISKIIFIISLFIMFIPSIKEYKIKERVDDVLNYKKNINEYEGYLYIPKFNYKNLIKKGEKTLDENLIELIKYSDDIGESNIILAGHNNEYVFGNIYSLDIGNEIYLSDFSVDYKYIVSETKYIKVNDYSVFNNDNSLTLITCTNDNQKRYVVVAKKY